MGPRLLLESCPVQISDPLGRPQPSPTGRSPGKTPGSPRLLHAGPFPAKGLAPGLCGTPLRLHFVVTQRSREVKRQSQATAL